MAVRFFGGDLKYFRAPDGPALAQAKCKMLGSFRSRKDGGVTFQWAGHRPSHRLPRGCAAVLPPHFSHEPYAFLNERCIAAPNVASRAAILAKCMVDFAFYFLEQVRFRVSLEHDGALVPLHASGGGDAGRFHAKGANASEVLVLGVMRWCKISGEPDDWSFYLARPVAFPRLQEKPACVTCGLPETLPEDIAQALERKAFNRLRKCAGCMGARYCSAACQKADWRQHKGFCTERQHFQKLKEQRKQSPVSVRVARDALAITDKRQHDEQISGARAVVGAGAGAVTVAGAGAVAGFSHIDHIIAAMVAMDS